MKLEGATSCGSSTVINSSGESTPTEPTLMPALISNSKSESSSSSESDSSNGGIEADTEESMTSEEEVDKPAGGIPTISKETAKEKWVAVKGQPEPVD